MRFSLTISLNGSHEPPVAVELKVAEVRVRTSVYHQLIHHLIEERWREREDIHRERENVDGIILCEDIVCTYKSSAVFELAAFVRWASLS